MLTPQVKAAIRFLIVDDDRTLRESCANLLQLDGYQVSVAGRGHEALELLRHRRFDIILLDLYMSDVSGFELLRVALETSPETIVIMMTGNPSVASSVEALRLGAWDYLPKPFSATHFQILVGRAVNAVCVAAESKKQQAEFAKEHGNSDRVQVLGVSPIFRKAIDLARRVAPTDASVFITGESGSGKELIAQFIHAHSRRSSKPLVAVNCAALPEALLESEMFGHCKGAFTGAVRDKAGLLEVANGGTLFLDELLEMSKPTQAKLLRVIQDGVVRRVGSETTDAIVNVRFIAATNGDPEEAVKSGALREDLYYRLRVVPIYVPRLQHRPEDIPLLANHFLRYYWRAHRDHKSDIPTLAESAVNALRSHAWPGNVRELQNVIEHAVVLIEPGAELQAADLPFNQGEPPAPGAVVSPLAPPVMPIEETYHAARERLLAEFERRYLTWLVEQAGNNISRAARIAAVDRTTLYRLMERHGLQRTISPDPAADLTRETVGS
ncbi:MAG TPA: sigma-54 dependent transcriptional regulator [Gemmatimonadales bacterium]|nr:sigma-54 dependent transcriptional regulator [Gemmatimonadales bacterium]